MATKGLAWYMPKKNRAECKLRERMATKGLAWYMPKKNRAECKLLQSIT
jgi:nitrogen fixation protein